MLPSLQRSLDFCVRVVLAAACCVGIWSSLCLARADSYFKQDTEESLRAAIRLVPDGWEYFMRLAQFDEAHAPQLLAASLNLNRFNAQADIELALRYEERGDFDRAEKQMLQAYDVDHTYLPRWSLANYYFRRGNLPAFWAWARSAAAMPSDDIGSLFELCWHASPDPNQISAAILNEKPEMLRQYVDFLLAKNQSVAVAQVAPHLVRAGDPQSDRPVLFSAINRLTAAGEVDAARSLWELLIDNHWVAADATVPNNAQFLREPLPVSFDWSFPEYSGLHSWPGAAGLKTEFTGSEPESCTIAEQTVPIAAGGFTLSYSYKTTDIREGTGIRWQVVDAKSNAVLAESPNLSSEDVKQSQMSFTVPQRASLLRLRLIYNRTLGTPRVSGMLNLKSIQIVPGLGHEMSTLR
jgi:tetratricopeptide (TPR) repeat protein